MKLIFRRHDKKPRLFVLCQNSHASIAAVPEWLLSAILILSLIIMAFAGIDRTGKLWAILVVGVFAVILYLEHRMNLDPWQPE